MALYDDVENIKLQKYIIAYIDILGTSDKLEKSENDFIKQIESVYNALMWSLKKLKEETDFKSINPTYKIFSDNFILMIKDNENDETRKETATFLSWLTLFQYMVTIKTGILLRGSVDFGNMYVTDIFILGKPLVQVAKAEKNERLPRIIVNDIILKRMPELGKEIITNKNYCIDGLKDDNKYYLNYLKWLDSSDDILIDNFLTEIYADYNNKKTYQKTQWTRKYFIDMCKTKKLTFGRNGEFFVLCKNSCSSKSIDYYDSILNKLHNINKNLFKKSIENELISNNISYAAYDQSSDLSVENEKIIIKLAQILRESMKEEPNDE